MRFKESLVLDRLISERRSSLSRSNLSELEMDKRALVLVVLMDTRRQLDEIGSMTNRDDVVIHTEFVGTPANSPKYPNLQAINCGGDITIRPADPGITAANIAKSIRRELRRGGMPQTSVKPGGMNNAKVPNTKRRTRCTLHCI